MHSAVRKLNSGQMKRVQSSISKNLEKKQVKNSEMWWLALVFGSVFKGATFVRIQRQDENAESSLADESPPFRFNPTQHGDNSLQIYVMHVANHITG